MVKQRDKGGAQAPKRARPQQKPHISEAAQEKLHEDDQDIAKYEKLLGIKGKKNLPKAFKDEGLAELLGDLGAEGEEDEGKKRKREAAEWLQKKRTKRTKGTMDSENEDLEARSITDEEASQSSSADFSEDATDIGSLDSSEEEEEEDENEDDGTGDDPAAKDDFSGFSDEDEANREPPTGKQKTGARENPYVAPVQPSQQQKYIPPSRREASNEDSENLARLRRQLQGQLNKLSEANIVTILHEIETIYQNNARSHVRTILIDLLFGFITALYKVIGVEIGAEFLQHFVELFDADYDRELKLASNEGNLQQEVGTGTSKKKALVNAVSLLSQLYNLHMVGCGLVFDYIRLFLSDINELNTELLLKIIRNSGPQLRADDPSSLKDIVLMIQPTVARIGETGVSVRTKFMIDTITDLKNNRMKTGAAANSSRSAEHLTQIRKALGALNNSRTLRANEPLRVGRSDILNAATRGKWWLVGASWKGGDVKPDATSGDLTNDSGAQNVVLSADILREENDEVFDEEVDAAANVDLLQLARAHRMNTDVRRSIFIAIMSAVDHRDAQYRIAKLRLKRRQEVEITRVLMHCAGEEDTYNPYYTLIARQLCGDRRLRMAFMFSLWDAFRRMGERNDDFDDNDEEDMDMDADQEAQNALQPKAVVNLAKMFANLIVDGAVQLRVLKVLDFAYMQPKTKMFVENLIVAIIIQSQQKALKDKKKKLKKSKGKGQPAENEEDFFDEKALVDVFAQARDTPQIVSGLIFFVRKTVSKTNIAPTQHDLVQRGSTVILDTLRVISESKADN